MPKESIYVPWHFLSGSCWQDHRTAAIYVHLRSFHNTVKLQLFLHQAEELTKKKKKKSGDVTSQGKTF